VSSASRLGQITPSNIRGKESDYDQERVKDRLVVQRGNALRKRRPCRRRRISRQGEARALTRGNRGGTQRILRGRRPQWPHHRKENAADQEEASIHFTHRRTLGSAISTASGERRQILISRPKEKQARARGEKGKKIRARRKVISRIRVTRPRNC